MNAIPQVLLVDDNSADTDLASDTLARCPWPTQVRAVADGKPAIDFLDRTGNRAKERSPDLVILDRNTPRKDGRAVLAEGKADPLLRTMPVVLFSASRAGQDVVRNYEGGANSYISKPGNLHDFVSVVESISRFWFGCAYLMRKEDK